MSKGDYTVLYWDSSAILSVLFRDQHSDKALKWANKDAFHLMSSLSYVETHAVASRIRREGALADILIDAALEVLARGPWRRLNAFPAWEIIEELAQKWPLRGADLWHLGTAKTIQKDLPEITILSFDRRLKVAAKGEGLCI
ncbi:MAG: type II toxin-antitoxin system VapC family toxin [Deltaproteobacteria bacterium]|nr:type II toxin-antitoxin system VapC family toxin [Deltaproteobacteria bacterium]